MHTLFPHSVLSSWGVCDVLPVACTLVGVHVSLGPKEKQALLLQRCGERRYSGQPGPCVSMSPELHGLWEWEC